MLHVITACHNRRAVTERFVRLLKGQTLRDLRLILVDDGSTDGTSAMVGDMMPSAVILNGNGSLWWGGALDMAYQFVKNTLADRLDDVVMFSNDDVTFPPDYLETALALVKAHPGCLICGCGYGKSSGALCDGAVKRHFQRGYTEPAQYQPAWEDGDVASSRSLLFSVKTFLDVGGFRPRLLPHYFSDYEWTYRAVRKGHPIRMCPELKYTFDDASTGDNFYDSLTLKKSLSKRSVTNPLYKLNYILLATPPRYIPRELARQLGRYLGKARRIAGVLGRKEQ